MVIYTAFKVLRFVLRGSKKKEEVGPYVGSLPIHFNSAWLNSSLLDKNRFGTESDGSESTDLPIMPD